MAIVVKFIAEENMVKEAIEAYRAAREGKCMEAYAVDLLSRVGTTVPGGGYLISIIMSHIAWGFVTDEMINVYLSLRRRQLLLEAELRLTQLQIELKKLEIEQLRRGL
ncbi:MAG: hypothetical protein Q7R84_01805 [bacterium]|nr:hypothetical protein [bacterium]